MPPRVVFANKYANLHTLSCVTAAAGAGGALSSSSSVDVPALTVVVLGASGDLAFKKTYPALFSLWVQGFLPRHTSFIGKCACSCACTFASESGSRRD